ncbi:MAG: LytR C-terminal domain-containing protein [Acidimicrobiia bacterium]
MPVPVPDPVAAAAPEPVASIAPVAPVAPEDGAPEAPTVAATPAARRRERAARARRTRPAAPPRPGRGLSGRTLWRRVVPLIATGIVAAVVVGVIVRNGDDTVGAGGRGAPARAERSAPMLVVHHGALGNDLVMVTGRDGTTGAVVMAPVATQLDVPSQGVATLRAIPVDDGGALLTTNVENLLGVRIAHTLVLDDAALTAALGPAAPVPVDLSDAVEFADRPARYRPGSQAVSAAQASELIGAPQSVDELDRLVTVAAVMTGWMDRLKDPAIARATLGVQPALEPLIRAAGAPDRRIETVPVDSITTGGGERFNVQLGELEKLVTRVFPHARLGSEGRPRTEILNGTGSLGVAAAVADKVVPAGARVTLTDNLPGFGATSTQVIYYNDQWRVPAQRLLDAMGCGSLRKAGQDIGIVDVTIVVGSDCPAYGFPGGSH